LSSATMFGFRKKTIELDNTGIYKMKWFPMMPVIFMLAYLFVGISIAIDDPQAAITGLILLAVFTILYFAFHPKKSL